MFYLPKRSRLALAVMLFSGSGLAQTPELTDFDSVPPVLEDNIISEEPNLEIAQSALFLEPKPIPTIAEHFRTPSMARDALISLVATEPKALWVAGQQISLRQPERVFHFYQNQDYPVVWAQNHFPHALTEIYTAVQSAADDALPVQRYHADLLEAFYLQPERFAQEQSALELIMTDAFLTLAGDLANGLVNPTHTHKEWNAPVLDDTALGNLLADAANAGDVHQVLHNLNANNPRYQALKAEYKIAKSGSSATPDKALLTQTLSFGSTHPEVLLLREKLGLPADSDYFDEALKKKVVAYQKKHKLGSDGIVGKGTRGHLNGGVKPKALSTDLLAINMERQRWLPQELGEKYILVNIPNYNVKLYDQGITTYNEKVVIGRPDRQTPAFVDAMRHVVLNPTWTVPPTILKDKRAEGVSDAYDLIAPGGKVVKPSEFGGTIPQGYALRMPAGPSNPLGRVKFLFPNKHAIYLHDTPKSGAHWGQAKSSGCIRIPNVNKFQELVLNGKKVNKEKVEERKRKNKEYSINIDPIPIYLVYWTAWSNPENNNSVHTAKDVYTKDKDLKNQYQSALAKFQPNPAFLQESFAQTQSALSQ